MGVIFWKSISVHQHYVRTRCQIKYDYGLCENIENKDFHKYFSIQANKRRNEIHLVVIK